MVSRNRTVCLHEEWTMLIAALFILNKNDNNLKAHWQKLDKQIQYIDTMEHFSSITRVCRWNWPWLKCTHCERKLRLGVVQAFYEWRLVYKKIPQGNYRLLFCLTSPLKSPLSGNKLPAVQKDGHDPGQATRGHPRNRLPLPTGQSPSPLSSTEIREGCLLPLKDNWGRWKLPSLPDGGHLENITNLQSQTC